jgi:hypothetical protein
MLNVIYGNVRYVYFGLYSPVQYFQRVEKNKLGKGISLVHERFPHKIHYHKRPKAVRGQSVPHEEKYKSFFP